MLKTQQVFKLAMKNNFFIRGCRFFVSDVVSGRLLGHLDPLHLALSPKRWKVIFHSGFYWKPRLNCESFDTLDDLLGFQVQKL